MAFREIEREVIETVLAFRFVLVAPPFLTSDG